KLTMVTNPATTVMRIAPMNAGVKPVPPSQVGTNTNNVIPLIVIEDVPVTDAIRHIATQAGLNASFDPGFPVDEFNSLGSVSVRWENLTARQALAAVLDNYYLASIQDPGGASARITLKTPDKSGAPPGRN